MESSLFDLSGEVALVTGAASGIGKAIVHGLARTGVHVGCVDLPGDALDGVVSEAGELGVHAMALPADVRDATGLGEAIEQFTGVAGKLSLAVNCAGVADAAPAEEMSPEQWRRVVDINVTGLFLSCQAEGRAMLSAGRGAIVNIASMSGVIANRGLTQAHYNGSKAAVIQITKSLAVEWASRGVRVNSLSPGYTATPMNLRPEVADQLAVFERDTPIGRMARPEEMVGPAIFLLSEAASFCTGVDLLVDGGFTCW